ncbi:large proline-rich protein bag6-A isoform X3 [Amborella trichopoda]|uniref:large proline-rich protein bag6-A isoform X3 n=1 Tax=Amborella trichopoda TaxID=13333 RepID=UPI0009BD4CC4|nr:large proline-rich protein bag6-A isoform X3 [Amborella trichopoda]|eukprot:XP_020528095.1 large proline-rich protein bag6-A isoform X3 [Amborella trichopoda]
MGTNGADEVMICSDEGDTAETTVEIKIKTLDSQTFTLRVNKYMPVPALKEQIATVTGVLSEQQRLICRGKVLKDDQLLSAYHVEDGHTLHLVVRQPEPSPSPLTGGNESAPDHQANDLNAGATPVAHSIVLGTFDIADQGDGAIQDLNRIVSAVLSSVGLGSASMGTEVPVTAGSSLNAHGRTDANSMPSSVQLQPEQGSPRAPFDPVQGPFRIPAAVPLTPLPGVIPDSVATLSQYLSHMRQDFSADAGTNNNNNSQVGGNGIGTVDYLGQRPGSVSGGFPMPANLAEVLRSSRQILLENVGSSLSQLAGQLEGEATLTDPLARMGVQTTANRTGILLQNLGAFLLELGRTTMTLRMGREPSEAMVNSGPAVFISPSGPNPMMVQPVPFQPGSSFGANPMGAWRGPRSSVGTTVGSGFLPRNIDIRIRTGASVSSTGNLEQRENSSRQQPSGETEHSRSSATGVRVVPVRTVVAALPASVSHPTPPDRSGHDQNNGTVSSESGLRSTNSTSNNGADTANASAPVEGQNREGSTSRPPQPSTDASRGTNSNPHDPPNRLEQLLHTIFPGNQVHVTDISIQGPVPEHTQPVHRIVERAVLDDASRAAISGLMRQIMPRISQSLNRESGQSSFSNIGSSASGRSDVVNRQSRNTNGEVRPQTPQMGSSRPRDESDNSSETQRSGRQHPSDESPQDSKRQKRE